MEDRISIEPAEDGDITIILRPRPRAEGDIEARIVRDAIDYLAVLLVGQGEGDLADILFKITEREDTLDPIIHTRNAMAGGGAQPTQFLYPQPRFFTTEDVPPQPMWRAGDTLRTARPMELNECRADETLIPTETIQPTRRR